jgi:hypothetical protein
VHADIVLGGITFDDTAFADELVASSGEFSIIFPASLEEAVTGHDTATSASSDDAGAFLELGFTDNIVVNGTGFDLVLVEGGGVEDAFELTIDSVTLLVETMFTGEQTLSGANMHFGFVDLDDFGVLPGASVSSVIVGMDPPAPHRPALFAVGALNVPEPPTLSLVLVGAIAVLRSRRG